VQCMCAINMHYSNFNINIRNLLFVKSTLNCIIFFQLIPYKEIKFSKFFHQRKLFQIVPWGAGSTGSPVDCVLSTPRVPGSNPGGSIYTKSVLVDLQQMRGCDSSC